ncbi:M10 family metallopeptidase [Microvirga roseola]|uniref:M10 family metallopeptidase n=1 Tax=Microvirga roseola TaxID=2883126 RepID=UPI001E2A700E|nr:M10 family metallopeptidase [Microvirga roseola]
MPAASTFSFTGNSYIDAILCDTRWDTTRLTYSFPTIASCYGNGYGEGEASHGFGAFSTAQQSAARGILSLYTSVCGLTFKQVNETPTQHATLRFAQSDFPSTAWAYFPDAAESGGDVWVNRTSKDYDSPQLGNYAYFTFVHEIGHALGLDHPHEGIAMPESRDSMEYTVMSYRSYTGGSTTSGYANETWGYAQSLMVYDIAALQHMYGANYATNSGSTRYSWNPTTGEMSVNGRGQGTPGGNQIFQTIWDGGGSDTYDFSQYRTGLKIDLQPGAWTQTSSEQRAKLHWSGSEVAAGNIANALLYNNDSRSLIENAVGGSAADSIKGNIAANRLMGAGGNDRLYGLDGNDVLTGGTGKDYLSGGSGSDYASYSNAKSGVKADLVSVTTNRGDARGDKYSGIEGFYGSNYADSLHGNAAANKIKGRSGSDTLLGRRGNDLLDGGSGNDKLYGQSGADTLIGGSGEDIFLFKTASQSRGSSTDTIKDFKRSADHIDLRSIDANTSAAGNQAFTFIGKAGFHGKAGELRFASGLLSGDVNGDGVADFQVRVPGLTYLSKGDFYL